MDNLVYGDYWEEKRKREEKFSLVARLVLLIGIMFVVCGCKEAVWAEVNMAVIKTIESNGNPIVISRTGAIGLYQIMPCVLQEFNQFNKTTHTKQDLFNPQTNEKIAKWYLNKRIPQLLRHYKKEVNIRNQIIAYNAGVRAVIKGYLPKETRKYLAKYERLSR